MDKHLNAHVLKNYGQRKCARIDAHGNHLFSFNLLGSVFPTCNCLFPSLRITTTTRHLLKLCLVKYLIEHLLPKRMEKFLNDRSIDHPIFIIARQHPMHDDG